jgi:predicted ATPase/DNA-binding XRE family transcriptional regulator
MATRQGTAFGALLKRLRLAAGLTQEGLAERAGLSAKAISDLERQPDRTPRLESVTLLADALGLEREERASLLAAARPDTSPPAAPRPVEGPQRSLSRPLTQLIGRGRDSDAVADLVRREDAQLVTLTGPGGVGKTRLAIEVAERLVDDFPDGVAFVDLTPLREPDLVLPTVARALGLTETGDRSLQDALDDYLRAKRLLLLLDNLEQVIAAGGALLHLLEACPRLGALVTSREPLRVRGEHIYRVVPLALAWGAISIPATSAAPAVELFLERAAAAGARMTPDVETLGAVNEICRRLDGLPLAIELAAAWTPLLPPGALLERLERRLPLLMGGPRDLPERQRTMRDAIAWSYDLLEGHHQAFLRRLSIFAGGCTLEAAEVVATENGDGAAAVHLAAALSQKSLLRIQESDGEPRLALLETIREFGLERLEAEDLPDPFRRRHAEWYLTLAENAGREPAGPASAIWAGRLERELDNLRTALRWARDNGEAAIALRLAAALWPFWSRRGYLTEGRQWLRDALTLPGADGVAPSIQVRALAGAALLATDQGVDDEGLTFSAQSLELARRSGERGDLVVALNARGVLERRRDRYTASAASYQEALTVARELGDRAGEAAALAGLFHAACFMGDLGRAEAFAQQAEVILRELGDLQGLAGLLLVRTHLAWNAGANEQVEALGQEALALFRTLADTGKQAEALYTMGAAAQFQGRYQQAEQLLDESLALRLERGDELSAAASRYALALVALNREDRTRARTLLEDALATTRQYDSPRDSGNVLSLLGHLELAEGNVARAREMFAQSAGVFQAIGNSLFLSWTLEGLAGVAAAQERWELAARLCGARDTLRARIGSGLPAAYIAGYSRTVQAVRCALDVDAFAQAYERGEQLSLEETIAAALRVVDGSSPGSGATGRSPRVPRL